MGKEKISLSTLTNGIIKENPVLVLILGTCPTLAVTTLAVNGVGMGLAATFVLVCSNIVISLLKNVIPDKVRIPCYIVIIAGFVTILSSLMEAFLPSLYASLGLFLQLIVVNCIILGRAEAYASKNTVTMSACDGIGMGLGFTVALIIIGLVREFLGAGTAFGITIYEASAVFEPISIITKAPGAFLVLAMLAALQNKLKMKAATNGVNGGEEKGCASDCESCGGECH